MYRGSSFVFGVVKERVLFFFFVVVLFCFVFGVGCFLLGFGSRQKKRRFFVGCSWSFSIFFCLVLFCFSFFFF